MPNQFLSPEGDLENYFVTEYQLIDQYIGDELWTWGRGVNGEIGTNTSTTKSTPVTTSAGGTNWKQVSSGGYHCAAIKTDGTLWTWGQGTYGKLGTNDTTNRPAPVTTFAGGTNWKQVSSGIQHTAAIKTDGTLWTWGRGTDGQLGENTTTSKSTPVTTFAGGTNWKQVSVGNNFCAAIKTDGTLWTWGGGTDGQLGRLNSNPNRYTPVTTFAGGTTWADTSTAEPEDLYTISAGRLHTAAIKTDGTLWTWGGGSNGHLGDNTVTSKFAPVTTFAGGTNWKQVSAGRNHTTAIKTDGTLWTWGYGGFGRLGDNTTTNKSTPVTTFAGGTNWKQVSSGFFHISAIKTDGTLWTWGYGGYGRLGDNATTNRSTPVTTFAGGTNWKQVSSGGSHTAAIKTDGTLWTWGAGNNGQLGRLNSNPDRFTPVTTFAGGTTWADTSTAEPEDLYTISAGRLHTAAIKTDGTLWTWGRGTDGQLGDNTAISKFAPVTTFAGGTNWKQVSSGGSHTAAIKTDGTLWTWGNGSYGAHNTSTNKSTPVTTFAGGTNWKQVSSGGYHCAAIKTDGTLWTWGRGADGRLGENATTNRLIPVNTFAGGTDWKQVSVGYRHSAAIKTDGTLWTWGYGPQGQLGNNDTTERRTPVTTFAGGTNWKQVSASGRYHTAAIKTDGTLWTWGRGVYGALGTNDTTNRPTPVTTFAGGTNWKQVSAGAFHSAAIKTDGTLWTWGRGSDGALGNNTTTDKPTPVTTFAGGTNWKQVSSGGYHTLALLDDGVNKQLFLFGRNSGGQLGSSPSNFTPDQVEGNHTNWKQVSSGGYYTAAIKTDGTLWTWGRGSYGQLGDNTTTNKSTPVTTSAGGTNWKQVSAGRDHIAAIKTDGTLWTWGRGFYGRLGDNTTTSKLIPVTTFAGGTNWKQVSSGDFHTVALLDDGVNKQLFLFGINTSGELGSSPSNFTPDQVQGNHTNWKQVSSNHLHTAAIKTDGTLWIWGRGAESQLGNNTTTNKSTPVTTFAGGTNWKQVSSGGYHGAAIKTDGTLWTWGRGSNGQLGNNTTTDKPTPVTTFAGGTNWKQVNTGKLHSAAIKTDGTLWNWGRGTDGQLGNNTATSKSTPVTTFAGGTNWKQVSVGGGHCAAVTAGISPEYPLS